MEASQSAAAAASASQSQQRQQKSGMNLIAIIKDYIESMLSDMPGRKALIMDK